VAEINSLSRFAPYILSAELSQKTAPYADGSGVTQADLLIHFDLSRVEDGRDFIEFRLWPLVDGVLAVPEPGALQIVACAAVLVLVARYPLLRLKLRPCRRLNANAPALPPTADESDADSHAADFDHTGLAF
jgi:hypothetical protein